MNPNTSLFISLRHQHPVRTYGCITFGRSFSSLSLYAGITLEVSNTTMFEAVIACSRFYASDADISGIGVFSSGSLADLCAQVRGSAYIQAILTLCIATFAASNEFSLSSVRLSIVSSFAINLTLLVARCQRSISPKNMTTGVHLAGVLWTAAIYSIGYRIQKHRFQPRKLLVIGVIICFVLECTVCCTLDHCLGTWNASPPYPCEGAPDYSPPDAWCISVSLVCLLLLPMTFFSCAMIRNFARWLNMRGVCSTFLPVAYISLVALIVTNEVLIRDSKGYDDRYSSETMVWGLGQILAIVLITGQVLEIFIYLRQPCRNSKMNSEHDSGHLPVTLSRYVGL